MSSSPVDFTSALYLGFQHAAAELPSWSALTTGRPAALAEPDVAGRVGARLATLIGLGAATVSPSTLHAAWDVFGALARRRTRWVVLIDEHAYPITTWAVERLRADGVPVGRVPHHRPDRLAAAVDGAPGPARRPIVIVDGTCPTCGIAPLTDYARIVATLDGLLAVDDTQALGLLGAAPERSHPLGRGGGGSAVWHGLAADAPIIVIASLAKAFGVPAAVTAAAPHVIGDIIRSSEVRVHCSPPSIVHLAAAERALERNRNHGDSARARLVRNVRCLRSRLAPLGVLASPHELPVQPLGPFRAREGTRIHDDLTHRGVRTVLQRAHRAHQVYVTLLVRSDHRRPQIEHAARCIDAVLTREVSRVG